MNETAPNSLSHEGLAAHHAAHGHQSHSSAADPAKDAAPLLRDPVCGMTVSTESPHVVDFRRCFIWTLPLTLIVTVLAMAGHRLKWFDMATQSRAELALSLPIVLWAGWLFFERTVQSVLHRSPNMWTLIGLGSSAAFAYSVVATVAPACFRPRLWRWIVSQSILKPVQ